MWLLEFVDDDVLDTGNVVFGLRQVVPKGALEHCLGVCPHFLASYRLSSMIIWSNRSKGLLFSVPATVNRRQQTDSSNARSRRIQ